MAEPHILKTIQVFSLYNIFHNSAIYSAITIIILLTWSAFFGRGGGGGGVVPYIGYMGMCVAIGYQ